MEPSKSQVPSCIRCDKRMWHVNRAQAPQGPFDIQPDSGLVAFIYGNYGSTYYDPFPGDDRQYLKMILCDSCTEMLEKRGQIKRHTNLHGE